MHLWKLVFTKKKKKNLFPSQFPENTIPRKHNSSKTQFLNNITKNVKMKVGDWGTSRKRTFQYLRELSTTTYFRGTIFSLHFEELFFSWSCRFWECFFAKLSCFCIRITKFLFLIYYVKCFGMILPISLYNIYSGDLTIPINAIQRVGIVSSLNHLWNLIHFTNLIIKFIENMVKLIFEQQVYLYSITDWR